MNKHKLFLLAFLGILALTGQACCVEQPDIGNYFSSGIHAQQLELAKMYADRQGVENAVEISGNLSLGSRVKQIRISYVKGYDTINQVIVTEAIVFDPLAQTYYHPIVGLEPGAYDYWIVAETSGGHVQDIQVGEMVIDDNGQPAVIVGEVVDTSRKYTGTENQSFIPLPESQVSDNIPVADPVVAPQVTPPPATPPPAADTVSADPVVPVKEDLPVVEPVVDEDNSYPPLSWVCCIDESVPEVDDRNYMALEWAGCEGGIEVPWDPTCTEFNNSR